MEREGRQFGGGWVGVSWYIIRRSTYWYIHSSPKPCKLSCDWQSSTNALHRLSLAIIIIILTEEDFLLSLTYAGERERRWRQGRGEKEGLLMSINKCWIIYKLAGRQPHPFFLLEFTNERAARLLRSPNTRLFSFSVPRHTQTHLQVFFFLVQKANLRARRGCRSTDKKEGEFDAETKEMRETQTRETWHSAF